MPRRPRKKPIERPSHLWEPGQSGNPAGKPRGTKQITDEIREVFSLLLQSKLPELEDWLSRAAQRDPIKAADMLIRISERFLPMLSRTEITGAEGQAFSPITINLPNIPKISLGEAAPTRSLDLPAKELGEGSLTEIPMFLPDREVPLEFREAAPAEFPTEDSDTGKVQSPNLRHYDMPVFQVSGEDPSNSAGAPSPDPEEAWGELRENPFNKL